MVFNVKKLFFCNQFGILIQINSFALNKTCFYISTLNILLEISTFFGNENGLKSDNPSFPHTKICHFGFCHDQ